MTKNEDLKALINWVESQLKFKPKSDLKRMKHALSMKHIQLKNSYMIHVAGTNGKGSVTQYLTQIFLAKGLTVGTYTSPYILNFNERINVNGKPLSDDELLDVLSQIKQFNEIFELDFGEKLSFFELLTLAAFMTFESLDLDVVIMEVGIGGLLDATNAYPRYDLSLITSIGYDHMKQLGDTLESIAFNKLGILRKNGTLLTTVHESLHDYFKQYADPLNIDLHLIKPEVKIHSYVPLIFDYHGETYESGLSGDFQVKNAILALEAALKSPFDIDVPSIRKGLRKAYLPARFERLKERVIIDGAHNIHAIDALESTLKLAYPNLKYHIVFSALADKDIEKMLHKLESFANQIDLVSFPDPRFQSLVNFEKSGMRYIDSDVYDFLDQLFTNMMAEDLIVITGSLHFVGYILNHYK